MKIAQKKYDLPNGEIAIIKSAGADDALKVKLHREATSAETHFMARYPEDGELNLGSFMMKVALEHAKANGFEQVELGVFSDNDRARHLYSKMGFKEYGMNPRAFKLKDGTYRDEIIMVNFLD